MTAEHAPIERDARAVRPPHQVSDDRFECPHVTNTTAWRGVVRLDRLAALREPLDGPAVSEYEYRNIEWAAGFDIPTVAVLVALLHRARVAAPLDRSASG